MNIIVCTDNKLGIAKNGNIPWYIPNDFKYFKETTKNSIVIMGYNTFYTLNFKPLKNRINIIFNNTTEFHKIPNHINKFKINIPYFVNSLDQFNKIKFNLNDNIFIIGGSHIYRQFLENYFIKSIYLTQIQKDYNCDIFFPHIPENFKLISYSEKLCFVENKENIYYRFLKYSFTSAT